MVEVTGKDASAAISIPRLFVTGITKGAGVSTVLLGLLVSLKQRGVSVGAAKVGPSLIEPTHHRRITGRLSHTIDAWMLTRSQLLEVFARSISGSELSLIEGSYGLLLPYASGSSLKSEADIASVLKAPVILVVDARGFDENLQVVLQQVRATAPTVSVVGVIANFIRDTHHGQRIRKAVESISGLSYLGGIAEMPPEQFAGKASINLNRTTSLLTRNQLLRLGRLIDETVDVDRCVELASHAGALEVATSTITSRSRSCRVAVADDQAFHLTIQDNLDLLRRAGADIVPYSPLIDPQLPSNIQALYLPSGYLHMYAQDVSANRRMLQSVREFAGSGGRIYAEGSSVAYLCSKVVFGDGETLEMAGVLPATAISKHETGGIARATPSEVEFIRASLLASSSGILRGFRDTRWQLRVEGRLEPVFTVREWRSSMHTADEDPREYLEGLVPVPNVLATGLHLHWGSNPDVTEHFLGLG